jgi:hypothetical protein
VTESSYVRDTVGWMIPMVYVLHCTERCVLHCIELEAPITSEKPSPKLCLVCRSMFAHPSRPPVLFSGASRATRSVADNDLPVQ